MALTNIPKHILYGEVVEYWEEEDYAIYKKSMMTPLERAENEIKELKQENILLQDAVIELASIVGAEKIASKLNKSLGN